MRIAIDARKLRDYGIGTYVRNLLRHLSRLDHTTEYVILCQQQDCGIETELGENFRAVVEPAPALLPEDAAAPAALPPPEPPPPPPCASAALEIPISSAVVRTRTFTAHLWVH